MYRRYKARVSGTQLVGLAPKTPYASKSFIRTTDKKHTDIYDLSVIVDGKCGNKFPLDGQIVRIYVTSTLGDSEHERLILIHQVFPKLRTFCKNLGYHFQVVDMRWGISEDIFDHPATMELCLGEVKLCQKVSTGPNFMTLLSHKYGSTTLPRNVEADEFEKILGAVKNKENLQLIKKWFRKDENVVPVAYVLQEFENGPFASQTENEDTLKADRGKMIESLKMILTEAATKALNNKDSLKYRLSVVEREIEAGINNAEQCSKSLWFQRNFVDIDGQKGSDMLLAYKDVNSESQKQLKNLKTTKLTAKLDPSNIVKFDMHWSKNGIEPNKIAEHKEYLEKFHVSLEAKLKQMITDAIEEKPKLPVEEHDVPNYMEICQHLEYGQKLCEKFVGREDALQKLKDYVTSKSTVPFILHGEPGCGKTSLMAMCVSRCHSWLNDKAVVVTRFIGTTTNSSSLHSLLHSILFQISMAYNIDIIDDTQFQSPVHLATASLSDLITGFKILMDDQLRREAREKPLVIILDGFNHLNMAGCPHDLAWLCKKFYKFIKVIISTETESSILSSLKSRYSCSEDKTFLEIQNPGMDEAKLILERWLSKSSRKLVTSQFQLLTSTFAQCSNLLYMNICFEKASTWTSYQSVDDTKLASTLQEAIISWFLDIEKKHDIVLTSKALAYVSASRFGLSEIELEDILALDDEVLNSVHQLETPVILRVPPLLMARLRESLQSYMVESLCDGILVKNWSHQLISAIAAHRYLECKGPEHTTKIHQTIGEYYLGTWSDQAKSYTDCQGTTSPKERLVCVQPLKYNNGDFNIRKLMEMPIHLIKGKMIEILEREVFYNLEWLTSKIKASSFRDLIFDMENAMKLIPEGKWDLKSLKYLFKFMQLNESALRYNPYQLPGKFIGQYQTEGLNNKNLDEFKSQCLNPPHPTFFTSSSGQQPIAEDLQYQLQTIGNILGLDISGDGKYAVACTDENIITVWDLNQVTVKSSLIDICHKQSNMHDVHLCCNDSMIVLSCSSGRFTYMLKCFDFETTKEISVEEQPTFSFYCIFREDKSKVMFYYKHTISVMDIRNWDTLLKSVTDPDYVNKELPFQIARESILLAASNHILALSDIEDNEVLIYDMNKKSFLPKITIPCDTDSESEENLCISDMVITTDAKQLLISDSQNNDLHFIDTQKGSYIKKIEGRGYSDMQLAFGDKFLISSQKHEVLIWNLQDDEEEWYFKHQEYIQNMAASKDLSRFVTATDNVLNVWDRETKYMLKENKENKICYEFLGLHPFRNSNRYILLVYVTPDYENKYFQVYDVHQEKSVKTLKLEKEFEEGTMYFLNHDQIILVANTRLKVFSLVENKVVKVLQGQLPQRCTEFKVIHDDTEIVTFSKSKRNLKVLSLESCKTTHILETCSYASMNGFEVNCSGTIAATYEDSNDTESPYLIFVFSLETYELMHELPVNETGITDCGITNDGKYLVHGLFYRDYETEVKESKIAIVWDLETGNVLHELYDEETFKKYKDVMEENSDSHMTFIYPGSHKLYQGLKPLYLQCSNTGRFKVFDIVTGNVETNFALPHKLKNNTQFLPTPESLGSNPKYIVTRGSGDDENGAFWVLNSDKWEYMASYKVDLQIILLAQMKDGMTFVGANDRTSSKPLIFKLYDPSRKTAENPDPIVFPDEADPIEIKLLDENDLEEDPEDPDVESEEDNEEDEDNNEDDDD